MSLILKKEPGNFEPHPVTENPVRAVIVDVTPVKPVEKTDKKTGEKYTKQVFRLVYETEVTNEEGKRFCVWSRQYSADGRDPLNEKSNLRIDIKKILGRDLTAAELEAFDVEAALLGRVVRLMVDHEDHEGKVYDQIVMLKASNDDFKPCGAYVRIKDRKKDGDATYQKSEKPGPTANASNATSAPAGSTSPAATTSAPADDAGDDWTVTKVHLEGFNGLPLCDLDAETTIPKLVNEELPKLEEKKLKSAADKRLIVALKKAKEELGL